MDSLTDLFNVGACIVNPENRKIVGIGHNALPESDGWSQESSFPYWENRDLDKCEFQGTKYAYVCHAAINAILNKNAESLKGCVLYTTLFPGHEDAKLIIQAGLKRVVYFDDKYHQHGFAIVARKLFEKAGVDYTKYLCTSPDEKVTVFPLPSSSISGKKCPEPVHPDKESDTGLSDTDFFMTMACIAARRSKDPSRQVGACIVNKDGKVVGIGYNGFPLHVSDDDPDMNWGSTPTNPCDTKYPYVVHAEVNAIMYKTCIDLKDCTLYTTLFPCNECAKVIVQSGIKKIYYLMDDHKQKVYMIASRQLLTMAGYEIIDKYDKKPESEKICQEYRPSEKCCIPKLETPRISCTLL